MPAKRTPVTKKGGKKAKVEEAKPEEVKPEELSPLEAKNELIQQALMESKYPVGKEAIREMLAIVVRTSLGQYKGDRASQQNRMIECVAECLAEVRAHLDAEVSRIQTLIDNAETQKNELLSVQDAAEADKAAKLEALEQAQQSLKDRVTELKEGENQLNEAKGREADLQTQIGELMDRKEELRVAAEDWYQSLLAGTCETTEKTVQDLHAVLSTMDLDESLLACAPAALKKEPSTRGIFDKMSLDHIESQLREQRQALNEKIRETEESQVSQQATVEQQITIFDQRTSARDTADTLVADAKSLKAEAVAAVKAAEKALKEHDKAVQSAESDMIEAKSEVEEFNVVQDAFAYLESRTPESEAEEAKAEEAKTEKAMEAMELPVEVAVEVVDSEMRDDEVMEVEEA